jgi:hypothetical protein
MFLLAFLGGIALSVYGMIRGVERPDPGQVSQDPFGRKLALGRIRLSLPACAGGLIAFGAVGSVLLRSAAASRLSAILGACLAGAIGMAAATWIVARWVVPAARREPDDPRYVLQGTLARVTRTIPPNDLGAVSYELDGRRIFVAARSLDGSAIARDADVVIERLDDGVAHVEPWSRVEERL